MTTLQIVALIFFFWGIPAFRYRSPFSFSLIFLDCSFTKNLKLVYGWSLWVIAILIGIGFFVECKDRYEDQGLSKFRKKK